MLERKRTLAVSWDGLRDHDDSDSFFEALHSDDDEDEDFEDSRMSFASSYNPSFRILSTKPGATHLDSLRVMSTKPGTPQLESLRIMSRKPGVPTPDSLRILSTKPGVPPHDNLRMTARKPDAPPPESFRMMPRKPDAPPPESLSMMSRKPGAPPISFDSSPDYDIWMAAPGSITERRKKLLHGMGLDENKEFLRLASVELNRVMSRAMTRKIENVVPIPEEKETDSVASPSPAPPDQQEPKKERSPGPVLLVRSRSDGDIDTIQFTRTKIRKEEMIGSISKQRLTRTYSAILSPRTKMCAYQDYRVLKIDNSNINEGESGGHGRTLTTVLSNSKLGAFFLIKNLDTGKEFIVNEYNEEGMWNKLSDLQTGKQLTMEEFEKTVGHSPVVKELMRRANNVEKKLSLANNYFSKSLKMSKKTGVAMLKSIKGVASSMSIKGEKEKDLPPLPPPPPEQKPGKNANSEWVKVRQSGKSYKELSALHMCQEFQAHEGSIWTIKFSDDERYLASAGEDMVIHVWEVQECEIMSMKPEDGNLTPLHPSLVGSREKSTDQPPLPVEKKRGKKGSTVPDYVLVPETVFSFEDTPYCSFKGHSEDILDLCWSRSQQLLSSSMDKTVRLWDLEAKTCLKVFSHKDYVTCIQFNPADDDYFISGSLDGKLRIWSIRKRLVVDWTDVNDIVTAVSYTPDGQGVIVGLNNGACRMYSIEDCKLNQTSTIEVSKKKGANVKKITGFKFAPSNPSVVLVTSSDSRIRVLHGTDVVHKYIGFKNASSQIGASFTVEGKYVLCASEDSQVFLWRFEEPKPAVNGKRNVTLTSAYESLPCKDVSAAITWHGNIKSEGNAKGNSKRSATPAPAEKASGSPTKEDNSTGTATVSKGQLPPLPKKNKKSSENCSISPPESNGNNDNSESEVKDANEGESDAKNGNNLESESVPQEQDHVHVSNSDTGIGESMNSAAASSASASVDDSPSTSSASKPAPSSFASWFDVGGAANNPIQPDAWGLVIVTASLGGEIRCYQNFGMPRKLGLQTNLF